MELKIFNYIEEATDILEQNQPTLEDAAEILCSYFRTILSYSENDYSNVTSRVKSAISLKEKILRNSYYKKYSCSELFQNLSDLIGIRIECRFIDDEASLYKLLKKYFNKVSSNNLYYNCENEDVKLELAGKQPQEQKNGFTIYRIDGVFTYNNIDINFELQIKSLVNIFWSEIEHKIIYKNYNYIPGNDFIKDTMASIKGNLTMIDNQLNMLYNQMNDVGNNNKPSIMFQSEMMISMLIYDIYSTKMKKDIGFLVDFRKSCDVITNYIFTSSNCQDVKDYNAVMLKTFARLNEISQNNTEFDLEIYFERKPRFNDEFTAILGNTILKAINSDFQWNVFFRILFEIEPGNNAEDFETFLIFLRDTIAYSPCFAKLNSLVGAHEAELIKYDFLIATAKILSYIGTIDFLYVENITSILNTLQDFMDKLFEDREDYIQWESFKDIYMDIFNLKLLAIFNADINTELVSNLVERIKTTPSKFHISKRALKYESKLEEDVSIKVEDALRIFKWNN
ncbi:hypothetical protein IAI10_10835 [Clostridium sp. 19966]|uniref:GTP pyrophosphokinase n=1 Tax=Clostridium sp. 19966 TaxID=2768166 RepID=UPI0028DF8662|nr:hypothetical protein [Clostridium sp. 19966]MDT8717151.1 hypothetical protein [Clostridium sp. 19966]